MLDIGAPPAGRAKLKKGKYQETIHDSGIFVRIGEGLRVGYRI